MDSNAYYLAHKAKDRRFDGKFFICVSSTKIYCRPICKAKTPKPENCTYQRTAAAAEAAGYRPCLLCRPELAPGNSPIEHASRLAITANNRIQAGALDEQSIEQLAHDLGISSRHLNRVLQSELGASPQQLNLTRKLHIAKKLLTETALPVNQIASIAGFNSARRLNDLFQIHYRLTPTTWRRSKKPPGDLIKLALQYREPYALEPLVGFFRARLLPGVEVISHGNYCRTVSIKGHQGILQLSFPENGECSVSISPTLAPVIPQIIHRVKRMLDLDASPDSIQCAISSLDPVPGLRLPGAFSPFETSIRAILGQQVSVAGASTLAARLVNKFGESITTSVEGLTHLFPTPSQLASQDVAAIAEIGLPQARAKTILSFAQAIDSKTLSLTAGLEQNSLTCLPGIGPWTAQYILMRCTSDPDAFPNGDLGLLKAFGTKNHDELNQASEAWRPYRAYAAIQLWSQL